MDRLRKSLSAVASVVAENADGIIFLASLLTFSYGCWLWFEPLGFMAFGGVICSLIVVHRLKG